MVQDTGDLVEHDADVLCPKWNLDAHELLDGHDVSMLVAHHRHVVEPIHVGHRLQKGFDLRAFLCRDEADQYAGRHVAPLAIELEHKPQDTMRGRCCGPKLSV